MLRRMSTLVGAQQPQTNTTTSTPTTPSTTTTTPTTNNNNNNASTSSSTSTSPAKDQKMITKDDFEFEHELGKGAYSVVYLTRFKRTGQKYATKSIDKKFIIRENKMKTVKIEKQVLHMMDHPNIIKLFCTFQDETNLYFALELASGGEMFDILTKHGPFTLDAAQFYAAEIVLGLEYMHSLGIIHRDMKPENLILTGDMHLKITDFGTARILEKGTDSIKDNSDLQVKSRSTFVGTANYVSPEVLNSGPCKIGSDLWALGCIIYQFLTKQHVFTGESDYLIFQKINNRVIDYPQDFPLIARDLIDKLLVWDPDKRLGAGPAGYKLLKQHAFFHGIDWDNIHQKTPPLIKPYIPESMLPENLEKWSMFLVKNENIVFCSSVLKRSRMSCKKRQLILTDRPRFFYIDEQKMALKGMIPWTKELRIVKKSPHKFFIAIPGRNYNIEDAEPNADHWERVVNQLIRDRELEREQEGLTQ